MSVITNVERIGAFTSSNIYKLTTQSSRPMTPEELAAHKAANPKSQKKNILDWPGDAAKTYIEETRMERRLGRSLTDEFRAKPLVWGKLLEGVAFSKLSFEYELCSQETRVHPMLSCWAGSPDGFCPGAVFDIKCPITLKSFCQLVDPIYNGLTGTAAINAIRESHSDGDKYYWQLVSNAILLGLDEAELIVYMPYQSELPEIRRLAMDNDDAYWIWSAYENELPYLIDGGYYKNINIIRFPIPKEDKVLLTECVLKAETMLT